MNNPDRIVCVNLDHRTDRWAEFSYQVETSTLLAGRVERFSARSPRNSVRPLYWTDGTGELALKRSDGAYACRQSHLDIWERAILDGVRHLMVFEDDAVLSPGFDDAVAALYADLPDDWFGYYLGGHMDRQTAPLTPNCVRLRGTFGTHAYGLSAAGLRRAHEHVHYWNQGVTVDWALRELCRRDEPWRFFAVPEWVVWQSDGFSDVAGEQVEVAELTGGTTALAKQRVP